MAAGRAFLGAACSSIAAGARRLASTSPSPRALVPALRRRVTGRCASVSSTPDAASAPEPYVLTTPLYYVNAPPHVGRSYTTIAADAIDRFQGLLGKKDISITGTDVHGEKIATSAEASGTNLYKHPGDRRSVGGGRFIIGGYGVIRDINDAHVQEIGAWAVAEHVKRANDGLRFGRVSGGEKQLVSGYNYQLRIVAVNHAGQNVTYSALVYEEPWTNTRQLCSFDRAE